MSLLADLSWKENENLGLPELNRRAKIISDAIEALRAYQPSWEAEVNLLREIGLERLNTALLPAFQQIIELTDLGALLSATSASEVEIGGGSKTFVLPEAKRLSFAPTPFLIAYAESDYDLSMVGTVSSYDRDTGTLIVLVESFKGEGTFSDWTIGPIATTEDLEALRDQVEAAAAQVALDKSAAQTAAGQAETRATDAETARTQAQDALSTFNAIWYGARDTDPESAGLGSQYLDTSQTPNVVKVLTESGWAPTVTVSIGGSRQQVYTATEGQTGPFTVDGGFSNGSVNVNGVEYFDGNGVDLDPVAGTFTFASPRSAGDLVVFRGYLANDAVDIYTKAETYSKAEVDVMTDTASQAEAEAGAENTKLMTPLRARQAVAAYNKWETVPNGLVFPVSQSFVAFPDLAPFRKIRIESELAKAGAAGNLLVQFSADNGATWITAANYGNAVMSTANGSTPSASVPTTTGFYLGVDMSGVEEGTGFMLLSNFNKAALTFCAGVSISVKPGTIRQDVLGGRYAVATAFNALRIIATDAGALTGAVHVEGIRG